MYSTYWNGTVVEGEENPPPQPRLEMPAQSSGCIKPPSPLAAHPMNSSQPYARSLRKPIRARRSFSLPTRTRSLSKPTRTRLLAGWKTTRCFTQELMLAVWPYLLPQNNTEEHVTYIIYMFTRVQITYITTYKDTEKELKVNACLFQ